VTTRPNYQPGDRLRVTRDNACGTDLMTGDLVSVIELTEHRSTYGPIPVVLVHTLTGPQKLTFNVVEPANVPDNYTPAEPDEVVSAQFFAMLGEDPETLDFLVNAKAELAKNDPKPAPSVSVKESPRAARNNVGETYAYKDEDGDTFSVTYVEETCGHGTRQASFVFEIDMGEGEAAQVIVPVQDIEGLMQFVLNGVRYFRRSGE
jgi:hypothetical protein